MNNNEELMTAVEAKKYVEGELLKTEFKEWQEIKEKIQNNIFFKNNKTTFNKLMLNNQDRLKKLGYSVYWHSSYDDNYYVVQWKD